MSIHRRVASCILCGGLVLLAGCGGSHPAGDAARVLSPSPAAGTALRHFPSPLAMFIRERREIKRQGERARLRSRPTAGSDPALLDADAPPEVPDAAQRALAEIGRAERLLAERRGDEAVNLLRGILGRESLPPARRAEAAFLLATACAGKPGAGEPAERMAEMNRLLRRAMEEKSTGEREARERFAALLLADRVLQAEGEDPDRFFADYGQTE